MLDTNIASDLIRNPASAAARRARAEAGTVGLSIIVAAELRYGGERKRSAQLARRIDEFLAELPVLPFASPADRHYGRIRAELESRGRPVGPNDLLIAAHALALDSILVTANLSEFQRVPGLPIENWKT